MLSYTFLVTPQLYQSAWMQIGANWIDVSKVQVGEYTNTPCETRTKDTAAYILHVSLKKHLNKIISYMYTCT